MISAQYCFAENYRLGRVHLDMYLQKTSARLGKPVVEKQVTKTAFEYHDFQGFSENIATKSRVQFFETVCADFHETNRAKSKDLD